MRKQTLLSEPKFEKQCAWDDHGFRCQADGHLSQSIVGGGPWYCRLHFASLMNWPAWQAWIPDQSMEATDKRVNNRVPRLPGESEHDWSMRCKDWVVSRLKKPIFQEPARMREPGEDEMEAA